MGRGARAVSRLGVGVVDGSKRAAAPQRAAVRELVMEQRSGRSDWSLQVWQFLTLELWMRAFLD